MVDGSIHVPVQSHEGQHDNSSSLNEEIQTSQDPLGIVESYQESSTSDFDKSHYTHNSSIAAADSEYGSAFIQGQSSNGSEIKSERPSIDKKLDVNIDSHPIEPPPFEHDIGLPASQVPAAEEEVESTPKAKPLYFLLDKRFWIVFFLGQVLSLCITATNTFNGYMSGISNIPAFQTFLVYALLTLVYTPYTVFRMGFKKYFEMIFRHGWKYIIFAFFDVEGNYFVVLAYQYTNMLSASLLDSWATVAVVILSFIFLKVRYHWSQILGVVACIGGLVLLVVSDVISRGDYSAVNPGLGDGYMIIGATCYGVSNTLEEYFASKLPLYVVIGQLSLYGSIISIIQTFIFDRHHLYTLHWTSEMGGYLAGFILVMFLLYSLAPILFRMSSATFYNISLLTSDFWSLVIGIHVFGYHVYWLYPIAFVLIILGLFVYHVFVDATRESIKPWLKKGQGVDGVGTVRRPPSLVSSNDELNKKNDIVVAHHDNEVKERIYDAYLSVKNVFVRKS
ncbi:transmembrane transporter [Schizosaccharomyces pombe]|uniref:Uncharacterized solute carrier family 35 member C320.08 n=1 Tax=Schizosaccharomyces pombe (strain 972 / ATCC 24843) TaxID=284812 RepID=YCN8_SCHPO|nr:putative transporter [Schizosaccharomyces pombe]O59785.1 RecName: Full=Uncharacterized solute carrier family 35 member C320.08 [Schizosaccharomyces pombe 972h-]CAA18310.1 membrane transporter (predicted) [Schizosaccharomyces pombe]|eukprot:NP_587721.1 putative transporter [Schizosaccharomyces pombe]